MVTSRVRVWKRERMERYCLVMCILPQYKILVNNYIHILVILYENLSFFSKDLNIKDQKLMLKAGDHKKINYFLKKIIK